MVSSARAVEADTSDGSSDGLRLEVTPALSPRRVSLVAVQVVTAVPLCTMSPDARLVCGSMVRRTRGLSCGRLTVTLAGGGERDSGQQQHESWCDDHGETLIQDEERMVTARLREW